MDRCSFYHTPVGIKRKEINMSETRVMKKYEELEFRDDFMFGKVMENRELCREVLECLLQKPVGELQEPQTQREFKFTSDGKPIRIDVYNEDNVGTVYDAEMQNLNNHSIEWHALPKRSRFYQASIDIDYMNKGNSYDSLPDSNIMFICTFDPFKKGLCQYTFRERCDEDHNTLLNEGTEKHFYNCCYESEDIPDDLRKLYEYIRLGRAGNDLTRKIDSAVIEDRRNETWRTQYMKERVIIQDAIREEREEKEKAQKRADEATKRAEAAEADNERLRKENERLRALTTA